MQRILTDIIKYQLGTSMMSLVSKSPCADLEEVLKKMSRSLTQVSKISMREEISNPRVDHENHYQQREEFSGIKKKLHGFGLKIM